MYRQFRFVRAAAVAPKVAVGDIAGNCQEICEDILFALRQQKASIVVFPELALTGYTLSDLLHSETTHQAVDRALMDIALKTQPYKGIVIVGAPIRIGSAVANAAVVISRGKILGVIPKSFLPNYKEFQDKRWFVSGLDIYENEVLVAESMVPFGTDIMIRSDEDPAIQVAVEICEDLWMPIPPSSLAALSGATILCNPSASNELVGKSGYRRGLVVGQSARTNAAYVYASSGIGESTTDVVFGGHCLIAELGGLLSESKRFEERGMIFADIDVGRICHERQKANSFSDNSRMFANKPQLRIIEAEIPILDFSQFNATRKFFRAVSPHPFLPSSETTRQAAVEEVFDIQVAGLVKRMEHSGIERLVLGLSGGLDSTLAFLVALKALEKLNLPRENLVAITMPGFGTTKRTKSNAELLATEAKVTFREIPIGDAVTQHLTAIGHDGVIEDITFENAQARERTQILMDVANVVKGMVLGTGDLSEAALGWCTYNGDHMSHYNVNCSIPKTLVRYVVAYAATVSSAALAATLQSILDTPISPELLSAGADDAIVQQTEDLIGPYELHDFFLYHFIRWGTGPAKITFLAMVAFKEQYDAETILKWLRRFLTRFFQNQFKRSAVPDGPKVGSVSLSPRGDWRMASDTVMKEWLKPLEKTTVFAEMRELALTFGDS